MTAREPPPPPMRAPWETVITGFLDLIFGKVAGAESEEIAQTGGITPAPKTSPIRLPAFEGFMSGLLDLIVPVKDELAAQSPELAQAVSTVLASPRTRSSMAATPAPAPVRTRATMASVVPDATWQAETYQRWRDLAHNEAVATNPRVEAGKALVRTVATMTPNLSPEMKKLVNQVTRPGKGARTRGTMAPTAASTAQLPGSSYPAPSGVTYPVYQAGQAGFPPGFHRPSYAPGSIRESLLNILDRFSNAVAGGQRHPSGLASPFMVYGSALEDAMPTYMPAELFDSQTIASMTGTQPVGYSPDGVPIMGAPPMGASLSYFPVPGYESALQNDWMEPRAYRGGYHEGTDIVAPQGTPIVAPATGTIASIHTSTNGGNVVWLVDSEGRTHKFMHLLATASGVGVGTQVTAGQPIAFVGDTGHSSTPHLHYELHVGGAPVNPHDYLLGVSSGQAVGGITPFTATEAREGGGPTTPTPPSEPSAEGSVETLERAVRSPGVRIE